MTDKNPMQNYPDNLDDTTQVHFDENPKTVEAIVAAIPKVVSWLKKTKGVELGIKQMFFIDYDNGCDESGTMDRDYPMCAMGHVFYEAGLAGEIGDTENDESPAAFFWDPDIVDKVQKVANVNDEDGNPDRIPEVIRALEELRTELVRLKK
jgi:hypothetical protein